MSNQRAMNRHALASAQPDDLSSEAQWMEVDMEVGHCYPILSEYRVQYNLRLIIFHLKF